MKYIPGTTLELTDENSAAFDSLDAIFSAAGGLSLSQVSAISGLTPATIHNWVKRGWIPKPVGKRYDKRSFSRMLIINVLHNCISLERIAQLMRYVNGSVDDDADDIITDYELYRMLATAVLRFGRDSDISADRIPGYVDELLFSYTAPTPDAKERVSKALNIMLLADLSSVIQRRVDDLISTI